MLNTIQFRRPWFIGGVAVLVVIAVVIISVLVFNNNSAKTTDDGVEFTPISSKQRTIQLESETGVSTLRDYSVAGRVVQPDLPLDEEKMRAISEKIAREYYPNFSGDSPAISQKTHDTLGSYWEARFKGRTAFYQLWRPKGGDVIITVNAKTRVYDVVRSN